MGQQRAGKWAIFVHDPDGDMGYGRIVGPFASEDALDRKAEKIREHAERRGVLIECVSVPLAPGNVAAAAVVDVIEEAAR